MSTPFNPRQGLIIVPARIWGPTGDRVVRMALDTGATVTLLNAAILMSMGYDPAVAPDRVRMTTGSGVEFVPRLAISRIRTLEQERRKFPILCHTLPPTAAIDGLLGLDFLQRRRLVVDFGRRTVSLK